MRRLCCRGIHSVVGAASHRVCITPSYARGGEYRLMSMMTDPPAGPTHEPVWLHLVRSVGTACENSSVERMEAPLEVWCSRFHPALMSLCSQDDISPSLEREVEALFPTPVGDVPLYLQALCQLAEHLRSQCSCTEGDRDGARVASAFAEVRAFVMLLAQFQLGEHVQQLCCILETKSAEAVTDTTSRSSSSELSVAVQTHGLNRAESERVHQNMAPLPPALLKQLVELIDTLRAILSRSINPSRRTRGAVYDYSVVALTASEQLPGRSLALLATSVAHSAEAHMTEQELAAADAETSAGTSGESESTLADELRHFLPRQGHPSSRECEEEEDLKRLRGGNVRSLQTVTLLAHLGIIAREASTRMGKVLLTATPAMNLPGACTPIEAQQRSGSLIQASRENLMSLAERKRLQSSTLAEHSRPKRRSIADIAAAAAAAATSTTCDADLLPSAEVALDEEVSPENRTLTLDDTAAVSSALASLNYRDADFWGLATRFTAHTVMRHIQENTSLDHSSVRDILFALDFARQASHYDELMEVLVKHRVVEHHIPPPSSCK